MPGNTAPSRCPGTRCPLPRICCSRNSWEQRKRPIATHLLFPQFMGTKETPQTREMALHMALILLTRCNELWYFGDTVSEGMKKEISRARWRNIPVRHFTEDCKEVRA